MSYSKKPWYEVRERIQKEHGEDGWTRFALALKYTNANINEKRRDPDNLYSPDVSSMGKKIVLLVASLCTASLLACGDVTGGANAGPLTAQEAKELFEQLPYRYKFRRAPTREETDEVLAGRAFGPHRTVLNFGLSLGESPKLVPVPKAGVSDSYVYSDAGFAFTSDLDVDRVSGALTPRKSYRQYRQAAHMEVELTDKLCVAVTGEHCPI